MPFPRPPFKPTPDRSTRRLSLRVTGAALLSCALPARSEDAPLIAAASDLKFVMEDLLRDYAKDSGNKLRCIFGSSGNFARQILQGAPFQLFFSADASYVEMLARQGRTVDAGQVYALGRLALAVPTSSPLKPKADLSDLRAGIASGQIRRFAIANPEHAPYGRAAREVLQGAGLWQALQGRLVLGENVSQAAQFALSSSTDGGLIAHSLALAPALAKQGRFATIAADLHAPLRQTMVLMKDAGPAVRGFHRYVQTPAARPLFQAHGFDLPSS